MPPFPGMQRRAPSVSRHLSQLAGTDLARYTPFLLQRISYLSHLSALPSGALCADDFLNDLQDWSPNQSSRFLLLCIMCCNYDVLKSAQ